MEGIIITALICGTVIMICLIDKIGKRKKTPVYTGGEFVKAVNKYSDILNEHISFPDCMENQVLSMDDIVELCYQIFN